MKRRVQQGYVLLTVVVMLVVVAVGAFLVSYDSSLKASMSAGEAEASRADYVAEAAMQHALWRTENNACMGDVTIPATALGSDSYTAAITGAAAGTAYTLSVDQDAWIRSDDVTKNNGGSPDQHITFEFGNVEQALTRFDLSSLPAGAQINSATAWFYVTFSHPEGSITMHRVTADWTEAGATWENMSGNFERSRLATIVAQLDGGVWVSINLTAQVQAWVNGQPNYGILMASTAEGVNAQYASRDGGAGQRPYLDVVVGSGPSSPVNIQATGTLANANTRTLTRTANPALQPPVIHTFSPGPAESDDAEIWAQAPNNNYGDAAETWVSSANTDTTRSLLRFNMGAIPTGARILGATLSLHRQSGSGADQPVSAHRIVNSWSEGSVTWNSRDSGANWDTAGGDFDAMAVATTPVGPVNQPYEWDVKPLVQGWVDGSYPNYGVALVAAIDGMSGERFYTSDQAVLDKRPSLSVTYACECGSTCMAPNGSGSVLMVVGDPSLSDPEDAYKKALFEAWGYSVDVQGDGATQTSFDTKIAANDVVYISETIVATTLGSKLGNPPIGIVNEDGWKNDDLGFETANSSNWPVGNSITLTDTSHYITLPFASGSLPIYAADMGGLAIGSTPAPDLQSLANWGADTGLAVLESGAMTAGGTPTAGRRVMLPFGRDILMDWFLVNNNGLLIMQRALQWGTGNTGEATGNLLFVVANAASPTSDENAKKSLIETWNYTVTMISDEESQANFDTALAANDVAYVSGDVNATTVGTKLTAATNGIVNEGTILIVELGFGDDTGSENRNEIEILDNTHSITSGFALGMTTIVTSNQPLTFANNGAAPGAQVLAQTNQVASFFEPSLLTLEEGSELSGGGFAPGKRVSLPWGDIGFDFNALNANGLTIMERAIEWAAGTGAAASPDYNVLLIVGNDTTLASKDVGYKVLIESWGHSVAVIDDGASQADYDTAMAAADVIYASGSALGANMLDKATYTTKGLVNEVNGKIDNFGFSSSTGATANFNTFSATNAAHYITEPFGGNPVTVFASSLTNPVPGGTLAPDLQNVGEVTGTPALGTLDAGATGWNGNPVPARRAHLPFASAETTDLTADGQTILQRAIEWGAGAGAAAMGPIAHWQLDETGGGIAVDSVGGHNGTLPNGGIWTTGQVDGALQFNGTDTYVDVPHDDTLSLTTFSISAWIRPDTVSGYHAIMYKGASVAEANYHLYTDADEITLGLTSGGWQYQITTANANLVAGQWYHLTTTLDGASGEGKHYLNGSLIHTGTIGPAPIMNTGPLTIGTDPYDEDWDGLLDDVRLYNRVLDDAEIADLFTSGGGGGGGGPPGYLDEFNSRNCGAADYAGTDGSLDWSPWSWTETSESNGSCSGLIQIADDPAVPDPGSFRLMLDERNRRVDRLMDLSGFTTATLTFDYRLYNYPTSSDSFVVIVSSDGTNWQKLAAFTGIVSHSDYQAASYDITPFIGANAGIGFVTQGINTIQTAYIDNVRVFDGGGGGGTFRDEFNAIDYSGSDGTLVWTTDWVEIGESDGPTRGRVGVQNDVSNFQLGLNDKNRGVEREADLSGHASAALTFEYRRDGLDNSGDYVAVEVSSNGGSTWTEIDRLVGPATDSSYTAASYDISAHIAANTRIRFLTSGSNGKSDYFYFDNVEIVAN